MAPYKDRDDFILRAKFVEKIISANGPDDEKILYCFSQNDSTALSAELIKRSLSNKDLKTNLHKYLCVQNATKCYEKYKDMDILEVAKRLRYSNAMIDQAYEINTLDELLKIASNDDKRKFQPRLNSTEITKSDKIDILKSIVVERLLRRHYSNNLL